MNGILNWVLYLLLGVIGPAVATLAAAVLMNLFQLVFSCRITGVPFSRILPWRDLLGLTALNAAFAAAFIALHRFVLPGVWQAVVLAAVWGALYGALLFRPAVRRWKQLKSI